MDFQPKKTEVLFIVLIILLLFLFISLVVSLINYPQLSLENTVEYTATVSEFDIMDKDNVYSFKIVTDEYDATIMTDSTIRDQLKRFTGELPKHGSKIVFRVLNEGISMPNKNDFVYIVSLSTDDREIFTLDDYNREAEHEWLKLILIHLTAIVVLIASPVYFGVKLMRNCNTQKVPSVN